MTTKKFQSNNQRKSGSFLLTNPEMEFGGNIEFMKKKFYIVAFFLLISGLLYITFAIYGYTNTPSSFHNDILKIEFTLILASIPFLFYGLRSLNLYKTIPKLIFDDKNLTIPKIMAILMCWKSVVLSIDNIQNIDIQANNQKILITTTNDEVLSIDENYFSDELESYIINRFSENNLINTRAD